MNPGMTNEEIEKLVSDNSNSNSGEKAEDSLPDESSE